MRVCQAFWRDFASFLIHEGFFSLAIYLGMFRTFLENIPRGADFRGRNVVVDEIWMENVMVWVLRFFVEGLFAGEEVGINGLH